jgi:hypothetical protein
MESHNQKKQGPESNGTYLSLATPEKTGIQCLCWPLTTEITGLELSQKTENLAGSA